MGKVAYILICALIFSACESAGKRTAIGAGAGAAVGAGVGAIIGHQSGNRGKGAAIGAALGGIAGGTYGNYLDRQAKELEQIAETKRTEDGIVTKLKGDITFKTGSAGVSPDAMDRVNKISDILKKYPEDVITIVGHTDSTGSDTKNQELSEERASAIRAAMVARGVPAGSVSSVGMGENQPVDDNATSDGRSRNRRVEIQIRIDESKIQK